jgi:hypothetical protein
MVYIQVRQTTSNYDMWRPVFDGDDGYRRSSGATGVSHVFRDVADPNTVTVIVEWDTAENANKFLNDPHLRETMQKAGVIGAPAVRAVTTSA